MSDAPNVQETLAGVLLPGQRVRWRGRTRTIFAIELQRDAVAMTLSDAAGAAIAIALVRVPRAQIMLAVAE